MRLLNHGNSKFMIEYKSRLKHKKKTPAVKWALYALVFVGVVFLFVPKYLFYKASSIIDKHIAEGSSVYSAPPDAELVAAYNYLQTANMFPGFSEKAKSGQKLIMDYYFPLFKEDYSQMKFACVDNAMAMLNDSSFANADSLRAYALVEGWKRYPDTAALSAFNKKWRLYHRCFKHSLPDYHFFVNPKNPKL